MKLALSREDHLLRWGFPEGATFETVSILEGHTDRPWPPGPWDTEPFNKVVWVDQILDWIV